MASNIDRIPRDRTKREHMGQLDKVIWSDNDQPCSILALNDGKTVVIDEKSTRFTRGQMYRFYGKWSEGKYGPQFKADTFVRDNPHTPLGVTKYLTDICSGVGTMTAAKLYKTYGPDAVSTLREQPDKVAEAGILTPDAAKVAASELQRFAHLERTRVDLFGLFSGRGFPGKTVELAISKFGARAPEVINADPYKLLTKGVPGCGWKRCDKLHAELGLPRNTLKRAVLAGWNAIREDRTGSTWLPAATVFEAIKDAAPEVEEPMRALKLGVRAGVFRVRKDGKETWIAIGENARAEQRIADSIRRLAKGVSYWPAAMPVSESEGDGLISQHQNEELRSAMTGTVGCLTGGPGTGKSYTIAQLLWLLVKQFGSQKLAVAAPTGKASSRITQYLADQGLKIEAKTIHRLLGWQGAGGFKFHAEEPLPFRFIVVDEASMIDTPLMASLLDACADGTHVLFVGDPFQLAPVGHGAPLRDLLAAGVPNGDLTEVRRNAGAIVRGCAAIKSGGRPELADRFDLDAADPINLRLLESADPLDAIEVVLRSMTRFDCTWDTQILCAVNEKSDLSRKAVNERFQKLLNPDGHTAPGIPFACGDKIICTSNSKLTPVSYDWGDDLAFRSYRRNEDRDGELTFIANGDIGRVVAVGSEGMIAAFGERLVTVPRSKGRKPKDDADAGSEEASESGGAMGDFELGYGITGHKSQGSQWPCTIVLADKAGGSVADRNWWYTTLSRAERACLIVGDRAAFETQCRRETLTKRKTFLAELLSESPATA